MTETSYKEHRYPGINPSVDVQKDEKAVSAMAVTQPSQMARQ